jgi:hemolysin activation/secretion protein
MAHIYVNVKQTNAWPKSHTTPAKYPYKPLFTFICLLPFHSQRAFCYFGTQNHSLLYSKVLMMLVTKKFLASLAALTLLSTAALAQSIPSSVDPGRINNDLNKQNNIPQVSTPAELTSSQEIQAPKGAEKITLVLRGVDVTGAQKISATRLASTYKHLIGKKISLADVYGVANAMTRMYRDAGYLLSRAVVPQQEIGNGVVKIQIVEGFVSSYSIQGADFGTRSQIEAYARNMMKDGALTSKSLERYLLLMNDLPGMKVRAVLSPSKTTVGGAHMTLVLDQRRFQGNAVLDNLGNRFLGPERLTLGGQANSLFGSTDQLNGTVLWTPSHDELRYFSLGGKHNVGSEGTRVGINGSFTETDPTIPGTIGALNPRGQAYVVSLNAEHPFVRSRAFNLFGRASFDMTENKNLYGPGLSGIETDDDQRILRMGGLLTMLDRYAGYNAMNATVSQGFEFLGASEKGDTNLSRTAGDPSFTKFEAEASRMQRLFNSPFTATLGVAGQYSGQALLASEEFGLGGSDYGRGYDSSEVTGDKGLAGKVEVGYGVPVNAPYFNDYQLYTFYDVGAVWNRDPGAGVSPRQSTASAGIGTRLNFTDTIRGDMYLAKPLTRPVASRQAEDGDDLRFRFSLGAQF